MSTNPQTPKAVVEVTASDVQGPGVVFCPNPKMALWSNHPRVFIDVVKAGEIIADRRAHPGDDLVSALVQAGSLRKRGHLAKARYVLA